MTNKAALIWKDIPKYEGIYEVSNYGDVRSENGLLRPMPNQGGYFRVNLYKNKARKTITVHSLVLLAFVGERPAGMHIEHLNHDKGDNSLLNLKYSTLAENVARGVKDKRYGRDENNSQSKLTNEQRLTIAVRYKPYCKVNGARAIQPCG